MKRSLILVLGFFVALICRGQQVDPATVQKFVDDFRASVITHDYAGVLEYMDKSYIKVQLDKKNDKEGKRFLDEFFSGYTNISNHTGYTNIALTDIKQITTFEMTWVNESEYTVIFEITSQSGITIYSRAQLKIKGKKVLGFFGAVG
jgi:hypothetical protein